MQRWPHRHFPPPVRRIMAKRKAPAGTGSSSRAKANSSAASSARSTVSGPARKGGKAADALVAKSAATEALAAGIRYNRNKENEYGDLATEPQPGQTVEPKDPSATASTLSESNVSEK